MRKEGLKREGEGKMRWWEEKRGVMGRLNRMKDMGMGKLGRGSRRRVVTGGH